MSHIIDNSGNIINCDGLNIMGNNVIDNNSDIFSNILTTKKIFINNLDLYLNLLKLILELHSHIVTISPTKQLLNMQSIDFQGMDLSNMDFSYTNLKFANFTGANLTKTTFSRCTLTGANFSGANLTNAKIINSVINQIVGVGTNTSGLVMNCNTGTPYVKFGTALKPGITFEAYSEYFHDDITYGSTPKHGLKCESSGITYDLSDLGAATNYNFVEGSNQIKFTIVWNGFFYAKVGGVYDFSLASDDGSYLWINIPDQLRTKPNATIDNSSQHPVITKTQKVSLTKGCYYPFYLIYGQNLGGYACSVKFTYNTNECVDNSVSWFYHL